ncbi:hypothetical protein [Mycobacterium leprae]|uniref:U1740af n=1 Tax=Mycobacterium leprae TaxID=1769 RepID=Q50090_MYCLR|nr:hypothetical protein [Mycobacterium leprae]AAA63030.1 u1740af [Mycobacterium leprae]OAR19618.1 hypothetical protein A8144_13905 [Mycobacterium leprae 3125609]OAX70132.1 hypothetical protein A3216_13830 [Mycobacterium leprae 7935681]
MVHSITFAIGRRSGHYNIIDVAWNLGFVAVAAASAVADLGSAAELVHLPQEGWQERGDTLRQPVARRRGGSRGIKNLSLTWLLDAICFITATVIGNSQLRIFNPTRPIAGFIMDRDL